MKKRIIEGNELRSMIAEAINEVMNEVIYDKDLGREVKNRGGVSKYGAANVRPNIDIRKGKIDRIIEPGDERYTEEDLLKMNNALKTNDGSRIVLKDQPYDGKLHGKHLERDRNYLDDNYGDTGHDEFWKDNAYADLHRQSFRDGERYGMALPRRLFNKDADKASRDTRGISRKINDYKGMGK